MLTELPHPCEKFFTNKQGSEAEVHSSVKHVGRPFLAVQCCSNSPVHSDNVESMSLLVHDPSVDRLTESAATGVEKVCLL